MRDKLRRLDQILTAHDGGEVNIPLPWFLGRLEAILKGGTNDSGSTHQATSHTETAGSSSWVSLSGVMLTVTESGKSQQYDLNTNAESAVKALGKIAKNKRTTVDDLINQLEKQGKINF